MVTGVKTEPRNFRGTFPLAGERIGPAWRDLWRELSDSQWIEGRPLARTVAERYELSEKTTMGLLWKAVKAGQLEQRLIADAMKCSRVWYRVADTR